MKTVKWKELRKSTSIAGLIIHIPAMWQLNQGIPFKKMMIYSGWNKGLWLKTDAQSQRIYPMIIENWKDIDEWKVEPPHAIRKTKPKKKSKSRK